MCSIMLTARGTRRDGDSDDLLKTTVFFKQNS